jgi:hypothetical protein
LTIPQDCVGGLGHHVGLPGEINPVQMMAGHHKAFGELLGGLGNAKKPARQRLNVLALEAGDEGFHQLAADLLGDFLFLAAREDEVVQVLRVARRLHQLDDQPDAFVRFLGGGLEQFLKAVALAEKLLDGKHARASSCKKHFPPRTKKTAFR